MRRNSWMAPKAISSLARKNRGRRHYRQRHQPDGRQSPRARLQQVIATLLITFRSQAGSMHRSAIRAADAHHLRHRPGDRAIRAWPRPKMRDRLPGGSALPIRITWKSTSRITSAPPMTGRRCAMKFRRRGQRAGHQDWRRRHGRRAACRNIRCAPDRSRHCPSERYSRQRAPPPHAPLTTPR